MSCVERVGELEDQIRYPFPLGFAVYRLEVSLRRPFHVSLIRQHVLDGWELR